MNAEEALDFVQSLLSNKNKQCLDDIQQAIFKLAWDGYTYKDMGGKEKKLGKRFLRDPGRKLWNYLTDALETRDRISKPKLQPIIEAIKRSQQQELQTQTNIPIDRRNIDLVEAPDVSRFFGRDQKIHKLKQWILEDRCRLVTLWGIGGIGKTFLAKKIAEQIKGEFNYLIWRSLREAPPWLTDKRGSKKSENRDSVKS